MESHKEKWERTKKYLISQMRQGTSETSTVSEGLATEGASPAPSSLSLVNFITMQHRQDRLTDDDDRTSVSSDCSTYSNLILERTEPEEFYQQFRVKVRVRNDADDSFMNSSVPRDATSTPVLSRKRRHSPGCHDTRCSELGFKTDSDQWSLCTNRDFREASNDSSSGSDESNNSFCFIPTSRRTHLRRGKSEVGSTKPESNAGMALMRRAFVEPIPDSSAASASSQDKSSAGPLSLERERQSMPVNAQLSLDSTSSNIFTSTPTHVAIEQNLHLDCDDDTRRRKIEDKRAVKRKLVRSALQTSSEESKKKKYLPLND